MNKNTDAINENIDKDITSNKKASKSKAILGICVGCAAIGASVCVVNNVIANTHTSQNVNKTNISTHEYPKDIINVNEYKSDIVREHHKELDNTFVFKVLKDGSSLHNNYATNTIFKTDKNYNIDTQFTVKSNDKTDDVTLKNVFETSQGDILSFSGIVDKAGDSSLLVSKYNKFGDLIFNNKIQGDVYNIYFNHENNQYVTVSNNNNLLNISKYDIDGKTLFSTDIINRGNFVQNIAFKESNLVVLSYVEHDKEKYNVITELDSNGNEINEFKIKNNKFASSVFPTSDGDYLLTLQENFNMDKSSILKTALVKASEDGEIQWESSTGCMSTMEYFEELNDGYLIITRDTYMQHSGKSNSEYQTTLYSVTKYSKSGEITWKKHLGDLRDNNISAFSETQDIQIYKDGTEILLTGFLLNTEEEKTSMFKLRFDENGNVK